MISFPFCYCVLYFFKPCMRCLQCNSNLGPGRYICNIFVKHCPIRPFRPRCIVVLLFSIKPLSINQSIFIIMLYVLSWIKMNKQQNFETVSKLYVIGTFRFPRRHSGLLRKATVTNLRTNASFVRISEFVEIRRWGIVSYVLLTEFIRTPFNSQEQLKTFLRNEVIFGYSMALEFVRFS